MGVTRKDKGSHFLKKAFVELASCPNIFGILAYAFIRPSEDLEHFISDKLRALPPFDLGVHVRVNLHVGTTTNGASVLTATEKSWRLKPTEANWARNLAHSQLPSLVAAFSAVKTVAFSSDQPDVARALAARFSRKSNLHSFALDANATSDATMQKLTAAENDGRFMIRSADWGQTPRWASLADLYLLSFAKVAVACAGPYSPSTFCELAAAIAAVRRFDNGFIKRGPTWVLGAPDDTNNVAMVFWCPAEGHTRFILPPFCEAVPLTASSSSSIK